jgi:ribosomal protein S18 acetylase RimI-like enzyme
MGLLSIRRAEPADHDSVHWIAASTGNVYGPDIASALERMDVAVALGEQNSSLQVHLLEDGGVPVGFMCFGPLPRTQGTWQLYAIGVDSTSHGKGFGRHLLAYAESEVRRLGGRLLLVEASSLDEGKGAVAFYERTGFALLARLAGFYRPGEDKLFYGKTIEPTL